MNISISMAGALESHATNATCATHSLADYHDWQERVAILTHEGGVEIELAKAAALVFCLNPPPEINPQGWQCITDILGAGLDELYNPLEGKI